MISETIPRPPIEEQPIFFFFFFAKIAYCFKQFGFILTTDMGVSTQDIRKMGLVRDSKVHFSLTSPNLLTFMQC